MNPSADRLPRTQEQRSEATCLAIQEATLSLLLEVGYVRLTTTAVAKAARVSRGALAHHFANKEDLVVRSIEHQLEAVTSSLRSFTEASRSTPPDLESIVDYLWQMMSGGLFYVTLEYLPEARHNRAFHDRLIPVVQTFHDALDAVWVTLAETTGMSPERSRVTLNATMCLIRGIVAQSVLRNQPEYLSQILTYWKQQLLADFARAPAVQAPVTTSRPKHRAARTTKQNT